LAARAPASFFCTVKKLAGYFWPSSFAILVLFVLLFGRKDVVVYNAGMLKQYNVFAPTAYLR
jgi:hypothetical protein